MLEDLKMAKDYGVRGFPTIFFIDNSGKKEVVYGAKAYAFYEMAILNINASITTNEYSKNWETLFSKYKSLTPKEFSVLSGTPRAECEEILNMLSGSG